MKSRIYGDMGGTIYRHIFSILWELHRLRIRLEIHWREKPKERSEG